MTIQPAPYHKDYEITDAMFAAFRAPGGARYFWMLFGWGTLLFFIMGMIVYPMAISSYVDMLRAGVMIENDPEAAMTAMPAIGGFFLAFLIYMIFYVIVIAIIRAAFFRHYFFATEVSAIPIEVGRDELRQCLSVLGYIAMLTVGVMLVSLIIMVPVALIAVLLGTVMGEAFAPLLILGVILGYVGFFIFYIWLGVRLNPAGALTALQGKTHVLAARKVSQNRFWPLFGSILVAGIIGYVATYVATSFGVLSAFSALDASDLMTMMSGLDPEATVEALDTVSGISRFSFGSLFATLIVSAGYSFYVLILAGPQAFFTRQWADAHDEISGSNVSI